MWRRTRDPQAQGQNEMILAADAGRLREWKKWLARAAQQPDFVWEATPVCGIWQVQFTVHNFAPALQKVVLEQQRPDGTWREVHARFAIEFRARAAQPRTSIRREFSAPVDSAALPLRVTVRGIGQVAISARRAHGWRAHAPAAKLEWTAQENFSVNPRRSEVSPRSRGRTTRENCG